MLKTNTFVSVHFGITSVFTLMVGDIVDVGDVDGDVDGKAGPFARFREVVGADALFHIVLALREIGIGHGDGVLVVVGVVGRS